MNRFLRIFLLSITLICVANSSTHADGVGDGFYAVTQLPEQLRTVQYQRDVSASERFYFENAAKTERCGGTYIGNDGWMITAEHCVDDCLHESNNEGLVLAVRAGQAKIPAEGLNCELTIEGNWTSENMKVRAVGVLDARNGDAMGIDADWAIVKRKPIFGSSCAKPSWDAPLIGGPVVLLGHPGATNRANGLNSNGKDLFASAGSVLCDASQAQPIIDFLSLSGNRLDPNLRPEFQTYQQLFNEVGGDSTSFIKRIDATIGIGSVISSETIGGDSGGGVFNHGGNLQGVISHSIVGNAENDGFSKEHERTTAGVFLSLKQILSQLKEQGFGDQQIGEMFRCD